MALVTFQVIDGFEKGRVYSDLATPVSIGREEDNMIQLNDERVSRFHAKIQEDGGRLILTDLDSTNGTRVNGHPVQMRVLQTGDQVTVGRSLLVFGSAEQIAERARQTRPQHGSPGTDNPTVAIPDPSSGADPGMHTAAGLSAKDLAGLDDQIRDLFPDGPPELPGDLRPVQLAQLSDVLAYVHEQIARVVDTAAEIKQHGPTEMRADWMTWQRLLKLEMQLAVYLRRIADPDA